MKKFFPLLLVIAIFISSFAITGLEATAAESYVRPKKLLYLVMDDSGSMKDDNKEADANYSLQALAAMVDDEDQLNISFLHSKKVYTNSKKSDKFISQIRNEYPKSSGWTPFKRVENTIDKMKQSVSKKDNVDAWLVIVTDGEFMDGEGSYENSAEYANKVLTEFADTKLANGRYPKVLFITVASTETVNIKNKHDNVYVYGEGKIIPAMNKVSTIITGRQRMKFNTESGSNTATLNLPFPVRNIVVFTQTSNNKINSVIGYDGLNYNEQYKVVNPARNQSSTICYATNKDNTTIPSGELSLIFDKKISQENTSILVEPALQLIPKYFNENGEEIDSKDIKNGETIKIQLDVCDADSKKPITKGLPKDIEYEIRVNDEAKKSKTGKFTIKKSSLDIALKAQFGDDFTLDTTKTYDSIRTVRRLSLKTENDNHFVEQYKNVKNSEGFTIVPYNNKKPVSRTEFEKSKLKIKGGNFFTTHFKVKKDAENQQYIITPRSGWLKPFTPYDQTIKAIYTDTSDYDEEGYVELEIQASIEGKRPFALIALIILIFAAIIGLILWVLYNAKNRIWFPKHLHLYFYDNLAKKGALPGKIPDITRTAERTIKNLNLQAIKEDPKLLVMSKKVLPEIKGRGAYDGLTFTPNGAEGIIVSGINKIVVDKNEFEKEKKSEYTLSAATRRADSDNGTITLEQGEKLIKWLSNGKGNNIIYLSTNPHPKKGRQNRHSSDGVY